MSIYGDGCEHLDNASQIRHRAKELELPFLTRHKAPCYAAQGRLLRGTRQSVTRHKAVCYAEQGRLLRGTRQSITRHKAVCGAEQGGLVSGLICRSSCASLVPLFTLQHQACLANWAQYVRCQLPCVSTSHMMCIPSVTQCAVTLSGVFS